MDYKYSKYKGHTIVEVPAEEDFGSNKFQVYFTDGSRSRLILFPKELIDVVEEKGYFEKFDSMLIWEREGVSEMTIENIDSLVGKRVYFYCKQYSGNADAEGIATITAVDKSKRNLISCEGEKRSLFGANPISELNYAFVNAYGEICLGDSDRVVKFKVL